MKNNEHKKQYRIDKFARKYYCPHARLNRIRWDKRMAKRTTRRINKAESREVTE